MRKQSDYLLLLGRSCDTVLQYLANFLSSYSSKIIFIDQDEVGVKVNLDSNNWYLNNDYVLPHGAIKCVFNRSASFMPGGSYSNSQKIANQFLVGLLDYKYEYVLNRPRHVMSNCSKPYQSFLAERFPFCFPEFSIMANAKLGKKPEDIIFKSISSVRSIVSSLDTVRSSYVKEPVLFQKKIVGDNIRVHVVGNDLVAARIQANNIDYRYCKSKKFTAHHLPKRIAAACVDLSKFLSLNFCGIDLIKQDNDYFFLEANPAPGYNYYENFFRDKPISMALLAYFKRLKCCL